MSIPTPRTRTDTTRRLNAATVTFLLLAAPLALLLAVAAPAAAGTPYVTMETTSAYDDHIIRPGEQDVHLGITVENRQEPTSDEDFYRIRDIIEVTFTVAPAQIQFSTVDCATTGWSATVGSGGNSLTFSGVIPHGDPPETFQVCFDASPSLTDGSTVKMDVSVTYGYGQLDDASIVLDAPGDHSTATKPDAVTLTVDGDAPALDAGASLETVDDEDLSNGVQQNNGNGRINAVKVTFDEAMDAASLSASAARWTVGGVTATAVLPDAADPAVAYVSFPEGTADDTDATPAVSYDDAAGATPSATDVAGNALAGFTDQPTVDKAAPVITQRGVSIGGTDLVLRFSEPVYGQVSGGFGVQPVTNTDFTYTDVYTTVDQTLGTCTPIGSGSGSNSCHVEGAEKATLKVTPAFVKADEDDKICAASATAVYDAVGNAMDNTCPSGLDLFGILPGSVRTLDADANGRIDAVLVDFTVDPHPDTFVASDWDVVDYVEGPVTLTGATLTIGLDEKDVLGDSGATPTVTYTASSKRLAAADFPDATLGDQPGITARDAAAPVLVHVRGLDGTRYAKAVFSEGVYGNYDFATTNPSATGKVDAETSSAPAYFTYAPGDDGGNSIFNDGTNTNLIEGIVHTAGENEVTLQLVVKLDADDLLGGDNGDSLAPRQDSTGCGANGKKCVFDAAGNVAATTARDLSPFAGPVVSSIETIDDDTDGYIDALLVTFDGAIDDSASAFSKAEWSVEGYTVDSVGTGGTDSADDDTIEIGLVEKAAPAPLDTGAKPLVSYSFLGAGVFDADGEALVPFGFGDEATTDRAKPILVGAHGNPGSDKLRLVFSENVRGGEQDGLFVIQDVVGYVDTNVGGASGYFQFTQDDGTTGSVGTLELRLNADLDVGDVDKDSIELRTDRVRDLAGNLILVSKNNAAGTPVASAKLTDVDAPTVLSVGVVDTDGNGGVDVLRITLSEPMKENSLANPGLHVYADDDPMADGFEYEFSLPDKAVDLGDSDDVVDVRLVERTDGDGDLVVNSGDLPTLVYVPSEGGTLTDASGNKLGAVQSVSVDGVGPHVLSAVTRDGDGDGRVDGYVVTFNEDVLGLDTDGWRVHGDRFLSGVTTPWMGDDARALLSFHPITAAPDTAFTPELTYDGTGGVKDGADNAMVALTAAGLSEQDGVAPRLWKVEADGGGTQATAYFTEGVDNGASPTGALTRFSFLYTNGASGGAAAIQSVQHTVGASQAVLVLDRALTANDVALDAINVKAASAYDDGGLVAPASSLVGFTDAGGAPRVVSVQTDDDGDGHIDAVLVQFNEDLDDATLPTGLDDWAVDGYDVDEVIETTGLLIIRLVPLTDGDTDETPAVSFTGDDPSDVRDLAGNAWDPATNPIPATTDAAAPVLMAVQGRGGFDYILLRFSEPVYADDDMTGALVDPNAFSYANEGGSAGPSVVGAQHAAGSALVRLDLDPELDASDVGVDEVAAKAGRVFGAEGEAASAVALAISPFMGPGVSSAETVDSDADGRVDAIRVTFDADLDDDASLLDADHWTVGDGNGYGGRTVTGVVTGAVGLVPNQADDEVVYLLLGEAEGPDTAATFLLDYETSGGGLVGADGTPATPIVAGQVIDGAGPVVFEARSNPGSDLVTVVLSESVYTNDAGEIPRESILTKEQHIAYHNDDGAGPAPVDLEQNVGTAGTLTIRLSGPIRHADLAEPTGADDLRDKVSIVGSMLWDAQGNPGVSYARPLSDGETPGLLSAKTVDSDGDGWIDGFLVTVDEAYDPATLTKDGFSLSGTFMGGDYADSEFTDATPVDDQTFLLAFTELADSTADGDTAETPALSYDADAGILADLSGNAMPDDAPTLYEDGAAPAVVEAKTHDWNTDGALDAYKLTFSEPIVGGFDHTLWSVGGTTATSTDTTSIATARLTVWFDSGAVKDAGGAIGTGATPELTYDAGETQDVADAAGNTLPSLADADLFEVDGAAPVLVSFSVQAGTKQAQAVFSEGVDSGFGGTPGPLTKASFDYDDNNGGTGATGIESVAHTAGQSVVQIVLDAEVDPSDVSTPASPSGDTLAVKPSGAYDAADLQAITGAALAEDNTPPTMDAVTTDDEDHDGRIDRVVIDFNEAIDFGNLEAADFSVADYQVTGALTSSTFDYRLTLLLLEEETRDHDTGVTPQVGYDADSVDGSNPAAVTDESGNDLDPSLRPIPATVDGADPVLVSAKAVDTDVVLVRFSEAVQALDGATAVPLGVGHFDYDDGAGDSGNTVSVVSHRLGDRTASIALERDLEAKDRTTDTTSTFQDRLKPVGVQDDDGNVAVPADVDGVHVFGGPVVSAIRTVGSGSVEYLEVLFSLPVDDSTVATSIAGGEWSSTLGSIAGMKTSLTTPVPSGDVDDKTVFLELTAPLTDTGARPKVSYTSTSNTVEDNAGEPLQAFSAHEALDGVAPVLKTLETVDDEDLSDGVDQESGDGSLDAVLVTVSEAVDDDSIDYDGWVLALGGQTLAIDASASAAANAATGAVDDDRVLLVLAQQSLDTSKTPTVNHLGGLTDLAGRGLPAFTSPQTSIDAAAPVLLSAASPGLGQTTVTLTFSEAVKGSGTSGAVAVADLVYTDNAGDPFDKGATGITAVSHSGAQVVATLNKAFEAVDNQVDTIAAKATVEDVAGVDASQTPAVLTTDIDPPAAVSDLAAGSPTGNTVTLTFTSVADDADHAASGPADHYLVRHHTAPITASNWNAATQASVSATPAAPGTEESIVVSGLSTETTYHFAVRVVDEAGNVGDVSNSDSATTLADGTAPAGTLAMSSQTHTSDKASPATTAVLTWSGISDPESGIAYHYKLSDQASYAVTVDDDPVTGNSITVSGLTDGVRYVHLAGFSAGGSKQAAPFKIVTDTVAPAKVTDLAASDAGPLSVTLSWTAPGDDGGSGTATDYQLYRSDSAFAAADLDSVTLVSGVVAPAAAGTTQSFEVTGLEPDTEYHFAVRARDDAGNAGALSSVLAASTEPDATAPAGDLDLRSTSHEDGAKSSLRDLAFGWDAATDPESDVLYRYALTQDATHELSSTDQTTTDTRVEFDGVEPGTWTFVVAAESAGGRGAAESFQVVLLGLTDEEMEEANGEVVVKVTRKGDANVVTWRLPDDAPADVEGVQVLRSNSPYRVVATIPAGSDGFEDGTFVDDTDGAEADSKYLVTMYYGESALLGKQPEGQDLVLSEPLTSRGVAPAPEGSLFGHAAFYLGLVATLAVVGFAIAAVVVHGRQRPAARHEPEHTSWEATA